MDFEADGSGAYSESVPGAMRTYFLYDTSSVLNRSSYANSNWYALIENDILASRPLYYSFTSGSSGHAVVCDGTRNGNEIHLNFGWGGASTAWYNMDNVTGGGYTWVAHRAVSNIRPKTPLLDVHQVVTETGADDGYLAPGAVAGMRLWIRNNGGITAPSPVAYLISGSPYLTVYSPGMQMYPDLAAGASASNESLYAVEVASSCPAGAHALSVIMTSGSRAWTNQIGLQVARLPRLALAATNTPALSPGDSAWLTISNTGIAALLFSVTEMASYSGSNYTWSGSTQNDGPHFAWQDISAVGTPLSFTDNDGVSPMVELGFAFPFHGAHYTRIAAGANGGIALTNGTFYYRNRALPTTTMNAPARFLAPLWSDLEPLTGGRVRYFTDDTQCIVTWDNVPVYESATSETFQAVLRRNGEILYQYLHHSGIPTNTIGIQGGVSPAGPALQVAYNQPFVHDALAVLITPEHAAHGLQITPACVSLPPGAATNIQITCAPHDLPDGVQTITAVLMHNDPRVPPALIDATIIVPEPASAAWWWALMWGFIRATRRYLFQPKYTVW